ncbi:anthranilate synthase component 1 [Vibrio sp. SS-MA-C1-2]|uniref:anthranilate synthase component 1 n=1 Tax=Vibrio sp. SS-MA-C1-2 TaxID=2908646 RepID=UPI001F2E34DE|nr:anthranilate synthase component 1 [Vibrio sp. SS-MA-C1-2]UJF19824.1 anthranilate synthase component 1 [Vibrio sp. SS-MA-C1-2]
MPTNTIGQLDVIHLTIPYYSDPTELYFNLCNDSNCSLLLESAEIESKENLQSLMLIDAAVRITCRGKQIILTALTTNGENVLTHLQQSINSLFNPILEGTTLQLTVPNIEPALDEDSRLIQLSAMDPLRAIRHCYQLAGLPDKALFLAGLFAYDLVENFEPMPTIAEGNNCPDYLFYIAETLLTIDHQKQTSELQGTLFSGENEQLNREKLTLRLEQIKSTQVTEIPPATIVEDISVETNISDSDFCQIVDDLKQSVIKGDIFQVVPSRQFTLPCPSTLQAYRTLKVQNPSPYMFYLKDSDFTLFGASPESALKYDAKDNQVEIYPIAGTRRRGKNSDGSINKDLDGRIELELRCDKKEQAEHMMLVDLARNDVARISQAGTRHVAELLKVDRYSHVMHLVSRVVGQLRPELDALHAYQASMNMGTLTGAPKIRAMQLIRQVEGQRRGSYGGAVGYLTGTGSMDTCIVIRSAYVEDGMATIQAGAGVVYDSIPQAEADETRGKAQAAINAIKHAHSIN